MDFDPTKLEALLDLLVECGVEEFEGWGFHVRFSESVYSAKPSETKPIDIPDRANTEHRADPASVWETETLWPGGKAPRFPDKKKG